MAIQSKAEIEAELATVETNISAYLADPVKFTESIGGSVKVSIPQYVNALFERRAQMRELLENYPDFVDSDVEGCR